MAIAGSSLAAPLPLRLRPPNSPLLLALLLAAVVAPAVIPQPALAASGGVMGGRRSSSSSNYRSSSSSSSSSYPGSTFIYSSTSYSSSSSSSPKREAAADHAGGTSSSSSPEREADADDAGGTLFLVAFVCILLLILAVCCCNSPCEPTTTVVKLQVALLGSAKSFQKELNEIAEMVDASDQRRYKFMLTEIICSLRRHRDSRVASSLSVDVKDKVDSWEAHFDKISIEERSKFDEVTLYSLEGIMRKKQYSKIPDGLTNEYIVLTLLVAADGALKFPELISTSDLAAVVEKLNSIPAIEIQGIHVFWTPQEENDVLSEEKLLQDYPYLKWDD